MTCLVCGQPTARQIASQAQHVRGGIELLLDRLGWTWDPALSAAIDRCVQLEGAGQ